jgi:hypothetical protein
MAHWRRLYRPPSHFDYIALWAIGASMLVGRSCLSRCTPQGDLRGARPLRFVGPTATLFGVLGQLDPLSRQSQPRLFVEQANGPAGRFGIAGGTIGPGKQASRGSRVHA